MTDSLERRPRHARTAAEAIVQADAQFRIFSAIGVRMTGLGIVFFGLVLLGKPSAWTLGSTAVEFHIPGVPYFMLSFSVLIGMAAVVFGAGVIAVGQWQVRRAVRAARENPVAAPLFDRLMPPDDE